MKKLGFTLAEVMIALSIVGVVAAIAGPAISNIAPDKNKVIYLDYYNKISQINDTILSDPEIYYTTLALKDDNHYEYGKCIGLGCTSKSEKAGYSYEGDYKYQRLLARHLGLNATEAANLTSTFTTPDNITWTFTSTSPSLDGYSTKKYEITMKLPSGGKPGIYGSGTGGTKPRWYKYEVDTYGNVTPGDSLSKAYVENPHKMNDKKKDYDRAAEMENASKK